MLQEKIWIHKDIDEAKVTELSAEAGISRLMAKVFVNRGITDPGYVKSFLNPDLNTLHDPFLLPDMGAAADRIISAINDGEQTVIYGDYDVDGVTSTSLLYDFLLSRGAKVDFYIPERLDEGYGLSIGAADKILMKGAKLLITVDCGVTAVEEVRYINSHGMQVIITDHHECAVQLPDAYAVVNPCRHDSGYPFNGLAGVGVVFKLVQALCTKMGLGRLHEKYLDLAALGTVADVSPLIGENRIIVKHGMAAIEKTSNKGLKSLISVAGLKGKPITAYGIGFALAPRINAAGRVGSAARAVELFTTADAARAEDIARELDDENRFRQEAENVILQQAVGLVESQVDLSGEKVIVVAGEGWHQGIIGIVSSKITERYHRPSILFSLEDGKGKGSGRSIEGFNLFEALAGCGHLLEKFGGHELAAGLSIKTENLAEFRKAINDYADTVLAPADLIPCVKLDAWLEGSEISEAGVKEIEKLAPFGSGNPNPVFAFKGLDIGEIRTVGDGKHLKLKLEGGGLSLDAIGFGLGTAAGSLHTSDSLDAAFSLEMNVWNNISKIQLNMKDLRLNEQKAAENGYLLGLDKYIVFEGTNDYNIDDGILESLYARDFRELIPERPDLAAVYRYIRASCGRGYGGSAEKRVVFDDLFIAARKISEADKVCMNYFKLKKSIEIFEELNFIKKEPAGDRGLAITLFGNAEKGDLEGSPLYVKLQKLKSELELRSRQTDVRTVI